MMSPRAPAASISWLALAAALGVSHAACTPENSRDPSPAVAAVEVPPARSSSSPMPAASPESTPSTPPEAPSAVLPDPSSSSEPPEIMHATAYGASALPPVPLGSVGLAGLQAQSSCGASASCGAAARMREPTADVQVTAARTQGDEDRVVAGLRAVMRACANQGLQQEDPSMEGQLDIHMTIAANGEVSDAKPTARRGLSADVAQCMTRRARNAQFPASRADHEIVLHVVSIIRK